MAPTVKAIDYAAIRACLANEFERSTGIICILEEQKGQKGASQPRPTLPYASFKITTPGVRHGRPSLIYKDSVDNAETEFYQGAQTSSNVSFHVYAETQEEAAEWMANWQAALDGELTQAVLRASGIAVFNVGSVADLSSLLNTGYEGRSQLDVQFGIASNYLEDLGAIETVEVTATVDGQTKTPFQIPE